MNTPQNPSALSATALVQDLDDATLRSGHALLDTDRAQEFSSWLDSQLDELDREFREFATPQTIRRSLGR